MTTLAQTNHGRDSRPAREPLTMSAVHSRSSAVFAAYELSGEARAEGGVRSEGAFHRFLDRSVTIHRLTPAGTGRAQRYYTFVQSIHAQATLRHPSVAQVFDAGIHDELPYAIIERPRGTTLHEHLAWLAEQALAVDVREVIRTIDALADLLEHAHAIGARVHNFTPANVVLTDEGLPVLLQLGIAETPEGLHESPARAAYSAPELLSGAASDHRSDIYALGALLHYALSGRTLAERAQLAGLPHDLDGELLETVVRKATARRPGDRYASVAALRRDLATLLVGQAAVADLESDDEQPEPLLEREVGAGSGWGQPAPGRRATLREPLPPARPEPALTDAQSGQPVQDPLDVPGATRAEFQAALAYTVLVPASGEAAAAAPAIVAPAAARISPAALTWVFVLLVVATALGAALLLG